MNGAVVIDSQGKQVDHEDRKCPAEREIEKQQRKSEYRIRLVEYVQKRKIQHDDAQYEKDNPGFPQLQAVQYPETDAVDHGVSLA
jgi:hypothetical protein